MAGYIVQPAPGGSFHVYPDGRKVFVKASAAPALTLGGASPAAPSVAALAKTTASYANGSDGSGGTLNPDSTYYGQQAQDIFDRGSKMSDLDQQEQQDQLNQREALRRMQAQQPKDEQAAKESANRAGLFYSGTLGKNLGDISSSYAQRQADALASLQARSNQRAAAKAALAAGQDVDTGAYAAAAADRQIGDDTTAADNNSLVLNAPAAATPAAVKTQKIATPAAAKPAATSKIPVKKPYRTVVARKSVFHVYPKTGRRVAVRRAAA